MFLSIIIPTYNDEKYLDECLASCLNQDIPSDNYEIICVDDGSTDRTPQMLEDYAARYPNLSVIHKEHGVGYGRNIGVEHARGDWLWFVDHDDLIAENCLGGLRSTVLETGCDRLEFPYYDFYNRLSDEELRLKQEGKLHPEMRLLHLVVWTSITKRDFLLTHGIRPHSLRLGDRKASYGVDCLYVKECLQAKPKIVTLSDRPYYFYRHYQGQSMLDFSEHAMMLRVNSQLSFALMYRDLYEQKLRQGSDSFDDAMEYVVSVRGCIHAIDAMGRKFRRIGMEKMRRQGLFPLVLPRVYTDHYSWLDCVKSKNGMGPLKSIAFYHSATPAGLFFYRILNVRGWLNRLRSGEQYRRIRSKAIAVKNKLLSGR